MRADNARELWFRLLSKAGYHRLLAMECQLAGSESGTSSNVSCRIRPLEEDDADAFVDFRQGPGRELLLVRIKRGHRCVAALCEDRIASVTWVATGSATLWRLNADFDLPPDRIYVYDSYTHPDFRGQRLQGQIFDAIRSEYEGRGYTTALCFVAPENRANLRSRARSGFKPTGIVRRVKIGPFAFCSSQGACPELRRHSE